MTSVDNELIRKTRYHINRIEKQIELMGSREKWLRVTAALNVLEDTDCAITYYRESEYPNELNGQYLFTYGLLQALFVQEDAVNSINIALFDKEVDFKVDYPDAYAVREMRDDVVGHPTNRRNKEFIYLAQHSLSKKGFEYFKAETGDNQSSHIDVNIEKAISDVASCVNTVLSAAIESLDNEFREYIDRHRNRKMKDIFQQLEYAREKVLTADNMAEWGYESTKNMVAKCEEELRLRYGDVDTVDGYKYLLNSIHELYDLIDNCIQQIPMELRSVIKKYLLQQLFVNLEELRSYCDETDDYFANYGEEAFACSNDMEAPRIEFAGEEALSD